MRAQPSRSLPLNSGLTSAAQTAQPSRRSSASEFFTDTAYYKRILIETRSLCAIVPSLPVFFLTQFPRRALEQYLDVTVQPTNFHCWLRSYRGALPCRRAAQD